MPALDTNVLVRWLTDDDAQQCAAVEQLLQSALSASERLFVPVTVMLELEWVLRARYRFDRASIIAALDALLGVPELDLQAEPALEVALWLFKQEGAPDFAACLHVGMTGLDARGPLLTFDRRAARLDGVQLLS